MKKIFGIILFIIAFAIGADVKPFVYENIAQDSATQQKQFEYMLQYKLWGTDYIQMGRRVIIPDKSGWNGSRGPITSAEEISLGGPVLTDSIIRLGNGCQLTTGPIRTKSLITGDDHDKALFAGNICLKENVSSETQKGINRAGGKLSCDSVPLASTTLKMPTIVWPITGYQDDIILTENYQADTIEVPEGDEQYDLYYHNIHLCKTNNNEGSKEGCKLYIHMTKNRLTRIFVDSLIIGNHTTISVILGDSVLPQNKYRGNVLIYSNKDIVFKNTDNTPIQGSFITTAKMILQCNLDFSGQLLANQLEIGDDFKGENFRFVKFDPDTLDFPELNKWGGLRENDSTVTIPIQLSDTATVDVFFKYCFEIKSGIDNKDGVVIEDFNVPPTLPICGIDTVSTQIKVGNKYPVDSIKINVKVDTLIETDTLVMKINIQSGAVLPSGDTEGELKIKIIDATKVPNKAPKFDSEDTILYVNENTPPSIIGTITATDPDGDELFYKIIETVPFKVDSLGNISSTRAFDYETEKEFTFHLVASDGDLTDTCKITVKIKDVNEPVHTKDTTCSVKENYTGQICKIIGTDEDNLKPVFWITNPLKYSIDSDGLITLKIPFDYETKTKDTVYVIVTDGEFYDTAKVIINVLDEDESVKITTWDDKPKKDTVKTNYPDHKFEWVLCEEQDCDTKEDYPHIKKDTVIKVCNEKKTSCDSIIVLYNDAPPIVLIENTKSTEAIVDYITIEEQADDKIYVNTKGNVLNVIIKDTVNETEQKFPIKVKLDTLKVTEKNINEYHYIIDETKAEFISIGGSVAELRETIKDGNTVITITKFVNSKNKKDLDSTQLVSYKTKQDGKDVTISYLADNMTGNRISNYTVTYNIDSNTTVSYELNDKKKIIKNEEGNITFTVGYKYEDDYGNKATASVEIVYDDILPKVKISDPIRGQSYNTNAIPVTWTVNGIVQDTLNLQRLEKGVNYVIRRYVDKAGNVSADTVKVIMKEAKDIDIELVHPVTMVDQDKVDEYYSSGHKYNDKKPYDVKFVDPKNDTLPDVIGIGFKVDIVLPSVSSTGSLATLDDIVKNGQIPVDDRGNIVGASTKGIPVDQYVEEHCSEEFQKDYQKHGLNIPLYDVKYNLHLWVYTNAANYVNDFNIEITLNDEAKTTSAGTVQMVIDWLADTDGTVKAKNKHALGTGAYLTKLYSKSIAKHRCDYKEQRKGDKIVKKDETMKIFGFKRPTKK